MLRLARRSPPFPYTTLFRSPIELEEVLIDGRCRGDDLEWDRMLEPIGLCRLRRSEEHTSELQSRGHLVCRLLLEKKKRRRREGKQGQHSLSENGYVL